MNEDLLRAALTTRDLGRHLHFFETTESTNLDLRGLAERGAPHGTAVVARMQTAGRGRRGHRWHSPKDAGLYASFLVRGPRPMEVVPLFTLATALAAHRAIAEVAGLNAGIRWPNDLLCRASMRKLGGILVESSANASGLEYAIIGVGLNLSVADRPEALANYATSVEESGGRPVTVPALFAALTGALEAELDRLESEGGVPRMLAAYESRALGVGSSVQIADDEGRCLSGRFTGIAADGALSLETKEGPRSVYAGMLRLPGAPVQPEW